MQFKALLVMAIGASTALAAPAAPAAPTSFPTDIQTSIANLQGYILNVIKDFAQQNVDQQTKVTDYSSTGRSLDFFLRNTFLPGGPSTCPQALAGQPLPSRAADNNQAIAYLQQAQLALISVSQDAINSNFQQGIYDACTAVREYGGAAFNS